MKNLQTSPPSCLNLQQKKDESVSHLLMGFLERKISPQTIADILRVQVFESRVGVEQFTEVACNRILESLTSANSTEDCSDLLFYFAGHPNFPKFLSKKAAVGCLRVLLRHIVFLLEKKSAPSIENMDFIFEKLSEHVLYFILDKNLNEEEALSDLTQLVKKVYPGFIKFMRSSVHFQHLRFLLMSQSSCPSDASFRVTHLQNLIEDLKRHQNSDCSVAFMGEKIREVITTVQKDLCFLNGLGAQSESERNSKIFAETLEASQAIFPIVLHVYEKDKNFTSKSIANWAFEISVAHERSRFFRRADWRWIRTLSERIWDDSLREPPGWVVDGASGYCALIFHSASALWLQKYSCYLLENVYKQTRLKDFVPAQTHYHYVEFLIRSLRKKSPFFAASRELLYALSLLTHLTPSEAVQFEGIRHRFEQQENKENNPVAAALEILIGLVRKTAGG